MEEGKIVKKTALWNDAVASINCSELGSDKMKIRNIAIPYVGIIILCSVGKILSDSAIWEIIEHIAAGLFAITLSVRIVQDSKKSSLEKKACSKLIEQICFIFPPNFKSESPFRKAGALGIVIGAIGIILIVGEVIKRTG